jgi:putative hydrolase of the HAD superfamily
MIWLFDLDNTLYPYSAGIYQHINKKMNCFLEKELLISLPKVDILRKKYVRKYGTTLLGMIIHHHTDPNVFLKDIHSFDLKQFLSKEPDLITFLKNLKGDKNIFTNSPLFYAKNVLKILGIEAFFKDIFSIETVDYYGKPNLSAYQKVLEIINPSEDIIFVDDEPANIEQAKKMDMKTIFIDSRRKDLNNYYKEELFPKLKGIK